MAGVYVSAFLLAFLLGHGSCWRISYYHELPQLKSYDHHDHDHGHGQGHGHSHEPEYLGTVDGKAYHVFDEHWMNYTESAIYCEQHNFLLATIETEGQSNFLIENLNKRATSGKALEYWTSEKVKGSSTSFIGENLIITKPIINLASPKAQQDDFCLYHKIYKTAVLLLRRSCASTAGVLCQK